MNCEMWISVIGSIASIISLMISLYRENKNVIKISLIICFVLFTSLSIYIGYLHSKIKVRENIEKSALLLIRYKQTLSYEGFVYAGLSFLESNKGLYPDSYERAVKITTEMNEKDSVITDSEVANKIEGILKGIAVINMEK